MAGVLRLGWTVLGGIAELASRFVPATSQSKLARSFAIRRGAIAAVRAWSRARRDPGRALVWLHAPSVGEGLQARAVMLELRRSRPDLALVYTYFSPSAESFAASLVAAGHADLAVPLPFDTAGAADALLDALRPAMLVFVKLDVWPVLVERAEARGVPVALVAATLQPDSSRLGGVARALLAPAYRRLSRVLAIAAPDAERLASLGVARSALAVVGDPRYDQVLARTEEASGHPLVQRLRTERPTLVAGSTWSSDDAVLLPAFVAARRAVSLLRLIVAPHEPAPESLAWWRAACRQAGLTCATLDAPEAATADVVLVDRVGVLGVLYALADVAFVGGGFHRAGLHSVLEPAAFGVPVLCGPMDPRQPDAERLAAAGALRRVADTAALTTSLVSWCGDVSQRRVAGDAARATVVSHRGAAAATAAQLLELLPRAAQPASG